MIGLARARHQRDMSVVAPSCSEMMEDSYSRRGSGSCVCPLTAAGFGAAGLAEDNTRQWPPNTTRLRPALRAQPTTAIESSLRLCELGGGHQLSPPRSRRARDAMDGVAALQLFLFPVLGFGRTVASSSQESQMSDRVQRDVQKDF